MAGGDRRKTAFELFVIGSLHSFEKAYSLIMISLFKGAHLPMPVMAGNDSLSSRFKATFCLSEIPRQAGENEGRCKLLQEKVYHY